jgi:hypothetical protein
MQIKTRADLVVYKEIMWKLYEEGMFHGGSLDALTLIYNKVKRKRGVHQPYAQDSKLDPSYIHNDNRDEMNADIKESVEGFKIMPGGQRLIESLKEKENGMVVSNG